MPFPRGDADVSDVGEPSTVSRPLSGPSSSDMLGTGDIMFSGDQSPKVCFLSQNIASFPIVVRHIAQRWLPVRSLAW